VWDASQTVGKPLPEPPRPKLLEGEAPAGLYAGRFVAERVAAREGPLAQSLAVRGALGARMSADAARRRFAAQASRGLAGAGLGPDGWLERAIAARMVARPQDRDDSLALATRQGMMLP
jgi:hypothetical protein